MFASDSNHTGGSVDNQIKPATMALIGGGVLLFISTLLDWRSIGANGWETASWGLLGIIVAVIGVAVAVGVALTTFGNVSLPDSTLGFSRSQLHMVLGFSAFLITFGQIGANSLGIGIWLGALGAVAIAVGGYMESSDGGGSAPPTQF